MSTVTPPIHLDVTKRHDFVYLFDVADGNPNGDPDAGNLPRVDPETMQGLVTDVAIKRKVRDWVDLTRGNQERYKIYVQNKGIALNDLHRTAHDSLLREKREYVELEAKSQSKGDNDKKRQQEQMRRDWMCANFYDVRTFGAVMSTGDYKSGQVRGPVQITFARSIDPIVPLDLSITRVAITQSGTDKVTEMGRKAIVRYALYKGFGFVVAPFAERTGFSSEDLGLLWEALERTWDLDHSASRGRMALRGLYIFSHEHRLGNAPAHMLFDRVRTRLRDGVSTPQLIDDYEVRVDEANLPAGVNLTALVPVAVH